MKRSVIACLLLLVGASGIGPVAWLGVATAQETDPNQDIPAGSIEAVVSDHEDGDKIKVRIGGDERTVRLLGIDAPELDEGELGECYAQEAAKKLAGLIPKDKVVYLEQDESDEDNKDRLLRYVWFTNQDATRVFMANEVMLRGGFAGFAEDDDDNRYDDRLKAAEAEAKEKQAGLWGICRDVHVQIEPTPKVGSGDRPAAIGETVVGDGIAITVSNPVFTEEINFQTPKGGYIFLLIDVRAENVGESDEVLYDDGYFSAKDLDTDVDFNDTLVFVDQYIGNADLSPGEFVTGQVVLEVQETSRRIRIKYDTGGSFGGTNLYWLVER